MHRLIKIFRLALILCLAVTVSISYAQEVNPSDTSISSIQVDLLNIFNQKTPHKYRISSIQVRGNKYFDANVLIPISGLNVGDFVVIPGSDVFAKAIKKLWSQNYFSDVQVYITKLEKSDIDVEIDVIERPILGRFSFSGIRKGERTDLIAKCGLTKGRIVTENMRRTALDAIHKYYNEKGFQNAKVIIEETKDTTMSNSLSLVFNITKGAKVHINNINFEGNTVDAFKLKKKLKDTKEMGRLTLFPPDDFGGFIPASTYTLTDYLHDHGFLFYSKTKRFLNPYVRPKLFASSKFNEKKYFDDKQKLLDFYNSIGYRDAAIVRDTVYRNSRGAFNIDLQLNEGKRYYFGNITWQGNTRYSDSVLTAIMGIKKGDIYNSSILNKKLGKDGSPDGGDVSSLYLDYGYLFFRADPVEKAVYNDTIDYEIRIVEGPQATIKTIRIAGNDKTKEFVIRRELHTIPGELFSRQDLVRSNRDIAQLNFFNQEKIDIKPIPNPDDGTVDINYTVEEKSSDQLELSAGWGGNVGLTGTVGVSFNNFSARNIFKKSAWDPLPMGDGQKLQLRVQSNGKYFRSYSFSFTEPWWGGKQRNSLTYSVFDTKYSNAYNTTTGTYSTSSGSYLRTTGATVGLTNQIHWPDDYFSASISLSFVRYTLKNYYISPSSLPNFDNGFSNNLSIKLGIARNSIDNPIFPRHGSNIELTLQLTPPYSLWDKGIVADNANNEKKYRWIEYHKWRVNAEYYVPLGKGSGGETNRQLVLKLAAKYGLIGRYNNKLLISPFERFQLGDAGLSNSYALLGYDIISQRGYPIYQSSNPTVNPDLSGATQYFTIFNKYTAELRYPISLSTSSTIFALGFFEAANGWYTVKEWNPFQLRRSVGLGMRFYLPMFGLLGFDYGIGLDRINSGTSFTGASKFTFMLGYEPE